MNKLFKIVSVLIMASLLAAGLAFLPQSAVAAQTEKPANINQALEKAYAKLNEWLAQQEANLGKADTAAGKVQELITKASANGRDVSDLEAALSSFNSRIAAAKVDHQSAAAVLGSHAGFDGSGKVTDRAAARQTLQDGRNSLDSAKDKLVAASEQLKDALRKWRQAQQPKP